MPSFHGWSSARHPSCDRLSRQLARFRLSLETVALAMVLLLFPVVLLQPADASTLAYIGVGANAQSIVNAEPAGTTFVITSGDHFGFRVMPKPGDTFMGEQGAVLDGGGLAANAFYVNSSLPGNVTIEGAGPSELMVVTNYLDNTQAQTGSIQPTNGSSNRAKNWVLQWIEVAGSYSRGVTVSDNMVVNGCLIDHNGRLGIGGIGNNVLIENSQIAYNNTQNVTSGFEEGGAKLSGTSGLVVQDNYIHDNTGPGLWTDMDAIYSTVTGNVIANNTGEGVLNEISHDTVISNNWVTSNSVASHNWLWGSGILISTSDNATVWGNILVGDGNGISGIQQNRGSGPYGVRLLANLYVQDNSVVDSGITGVAESGGGTDVYWRNNRYVHDSYQGEAFAWMNTRDLSWHAWNGYSQDVTGSWVA